MNATITRCPHGDLPVGMCACPRCRPDIITHPGNDLPEPTVIATVAYDDCTCPNCNTSIDAGEPIHLTTSAGWVCEGCAT